MNICIKKLKNIWDQKANTYLDVEVRVFCLFVCFFLFLSLVWFWGRFMMKQASSSAFAFSEVQYILPIHLDTYRKGCIDTKNHTGDNAQLRRGQLLFQASRSFVGF